MPKIKTVKEDVGDMYDHVTKQKSEEDDNAPLQQTQPEEQPEGSSEQERVEPQAQESQSDTGGDSAETETTSSNTDEVVNRLRARVAELETGQAFESPQPQESQEPQKQEAPKREEPQTKPIEAFVTDEEFDEIQTNPKKLNEVMLRVYQRARADAGEDVIRQVPKIVEASTARQSTLQQAVQNFYNENPDLRNYAKYVGFVANKIKASNPNMGVQEILQQAGNSVREDLQLSSTAQEIEQGRQEELPKNDKKPAFAGGSGNHKGGSQDTRTDFQKQADEMLNTLR